MSGAVSLMGVHLARWTPSFSLMSASLSLKNHSLNPRTPRFTERIDEFLLRSPLLDERRMSLYERTHSFSLMSASLSLKNRSLDERIP